MVVLFDCYFNGLEFVVFGKFKIIVFLQLMIVVIIGYVGKVFVMYFLLWVVSDLIVFFN